MVRGRHLLVVAAATLLSAVAVAQDKPYLGPQVGIYFPSDSKLRDELGSSWLSFGAGRTSVSRFEDKRVAGDWNAVSQSRNGSRVFMLSGSLGYLIPLHQEGADTRPYFAVRGGLAYIDYAVDTESGRSSGKRIGLNANLELGMNVGDRFSVSARYDIYSPFGGFRFDGLSLVARYGLVRF